MSKQICPDCKGRGKMTGHFPVYAPHVPREQRKPFIELDCNFCGATGYADDVAIERRRIGEEHKRKRLDSRYTLREYSELIGVSPVDVSRYERGMDIDESSKIEIECAHYL